MRTTVVMSWHRKFLKSRVQIDFGVGAVLPESGATGARSRSKMGAKAGSRRRMKSRLVQFSLSIRDHHTIERQCLAATLEHQSHRGRLDAIAAMMFVHLEDKVCICTSVQGQDVPGR